MVSLVRGENQNTKIKKSLRAEEKKNKFNQYYIAQNPGPIGLDKYYYHCSNPAYSMCLSCTFILCNDAHWVNYWGPEWQVQLKLSKAINSRNNKIGSNYSSLL